MTSPHDTSDAADTAERGPLSIDVRRGQPTPEELAALIAVVSEAYATETDAALAPEPRRRDTWTLSQRGLRQPLQRERGWVHALR